MIFFNQEENCAQLRLQITDYSNPTLNINSIEASAPARQLVFELKEPASQPLRLYFGNENVPAPHYDFENELQRDFRRNRFTAISATCSQIANTNPNRSHSPNAYRG